MLRSRVQKIKNAKFGHKQFQKKTNPQKFLKSQIEAKFLDFHKILQVLLRFLRNRLQNTLFGSTFKKAKKWSNDENILFSGKPFQKKAKWQP
jgi:hypothetical protein